MTTQEGFRCDWRCAAFLFSVLVACGGGVVGGAYTVHTFALDTEKKQERMTGEIDRLKESHTDIKGVPAKLTNVEAALAGVVATLKITVDALATMQTQVAVQQTNYTNYRDDQNDLKTQLRELTQAINSSGEPVDTYRAGRKR